MKTSEFFSLLSEHKEKALLFQYAPNSLVGANYHITEVKHQHIESVDCGAGTSSWKETIIQLWESPTELGKTTYLTVYKALSILKKVGTIKSFTEDAEVKFEYGNQHFHTAQLYVSGFQIKSEQLILKLNVNPTDCKAKDVCGIPEPKELVAENTCAPGSGCC